MVYAEIKLLFLSRFCLGTFQLIVVREPNWYPLEADPAAVCLSPTRLPVPLFRPHLLPDYMSDCPRDAPPLIPIDLAEADPEPCFLFKFLSELKSPFAAD